MTLKGILCHSSANADFCPARGRNSEWPGLLIPLASRHDFSVMCAYPTRPVYRCSSILTPKHSAMGCPVRKHGRPPQRPIRVPICWRGVGSAAWRAGSFHEAGSWGAMGTHHGIGVSSPWRDSFFREGSVNHWKGAAPCPRSPYRHTRDVSRGWTASHGRGLPNEV